jgi:carboxypeptidase T
MKRIGAMILAGVLSVGAAFAESPKSLVRLNNLSDKEIRELVTRDYDIARVGPDFLELVVTAPEKARLSRTGRRMRDLIPNLDAYVTQRLAEQTPQNSYFTYETMTARLQEWATQYPDIVRLSSVGKTWEGRDIWAVKLSDNPDQDEKEPAVLINGVHHAREWMTVQIPMEALRQLLEGYGKDERLTRLVNEREIWFVPMVNPDGYTYSQNGSKYWRKNRRNNNGTFGVDLNRNYGYKWGMTGSSSSPSSDVYHGPNEFSEPETQTMKALAEREHFQVSLSFHSYSELILYPFAYAYGAPNPDEALYKKFGAEMAVFNGYKVQNCTELYPCMGVSDDWFYGAEKTLAFTYEVGKTFIPPATEIPAMNALNVPPTLLAIEKTAAYAVNSTSGNTEFIGSLDLTDGLKALSLAEELHGKTPAPAIAAKLDLTAKRVSDLISRDLLRGDLSTWKQAGTQTLARDVAKLVRDRIAFECLHGHAVSPAVLAEVLK